MLQYKEQELTYFEVLLTFQKKISFSGDYYLQLSTFGQTSL